jgi:hypothetical protein
VLWRRSLDAVVLLPPGLDEPVTLAGSGPALWELLVEPGTVGQLATVLAREHDADPATIEADIVPVIERLAAIGAVEQV